MIKADGTVYTEWPPLFPLILSIANLLTLNTLLFAKLLHGLIYIVTLLLMLKLLKINIQSKPVYFISVVILIFSAPFLQMHVMLWSEPLFMLLIVINIILLHRYSEEPNMEKLLFLILIGALMYLQRKTGTIFIASTSLLIFYLDKSKRRGTFHSVFYLICCSIPVYLWYTRRYEVSGKVFGAAGLEPGKFITNTEEFFHTFTSYFLPSTVPLSMRITIVFFLFALAALVILKNKNLQNLLKNNLYLKVSIFKTLFYYSCLLIFLIYIQIDDSIDDRILSPVLLPLYISLIIIIDAVYLKANEIKKEYAMLFLIPIILWAFYSSIRTAYHINRWNTTGTGGYNSLPWRQNKIITYFIQSEIPIDTLYTNNIYPLKYFLNFKMKSTSTILPKEKITDTPINGILVCFEKEWTYPEKECRTNKTNKKEILIHNQDGVIWQLNNQEK